MAGLNCEAHISSKLAPLFSMEFIRKDETKEDLIKLYKALLLPRLIEDKMLILLRQGKISKWFSGYGQEAISVGLTTALEEDEFILPMHRNLGVFTSRHVSLQRLFSQFQGKDGGFSRGRDRSFHFGSRENHIVGMISHLGSQMGVADGIALGEQLLNSGKVTVVFTGDGGASEGDFHEALNVAAVWDLPVLFVIENNGWGLSTPSSEQFKFRNFIDKGPGYGIEAHIVDGNNVLEVNQKVKELASIIRTETRPMILECITFRMRGHEEASGTKYYPEGIQDQWAVYDPVENFYHYLLNEGIISAKSATQIKEELQEVINDAWNWAVEEDEVEFSLEEELRDVFGPHEEESHPPSGELTEMRFVDAVANAMDLAMAKHSNLILMGQDIAEYGGVFKVTEGLCEKYGKSRVRNTPLCEAAIVGSSLGLSVKGFKSMVEMQFADFVTEGFNQIVNNLAKSYWRWGQHSDVVIRMPTGAGVAAGPFHSQSNEAWFFHVPGLKIYYPAFPDDAKGMLLKAFEEPNPVMFFEHKALYRSVKGDVPQGYYSEDSGKAKLVSSGIDLSIITYGMGVHWALEVAEQRTDLSMDILDLRYLNPLDIESMVESGKKTGRILVLHEDNLTGGIGGEIASILSEKCFEHLDAPVMRLGSIDTPVPFAKNLEEGYLAKSRLEEALEKLLSY